MSNSKRTETAPADLSALDAAAATLTAVLIGLFGSALLGVLLAIAIRRRGLAWTWSLPTALPFLLALGTLLTGILPLTRPVAIAAASSLGLAAGTIGWSARARLEDRSAGGDRETAALARRGPLDGLRRRFSSRRRAGAGQLPIGRTARGELVTIPRGTARSGCHTLITGATGAGKTTSLAALLAEYVIGSGFGAVVLEAKSDSALCDVARRSAAARGVPFHLISPAGPSGYDPLARGEIDERSERLIGTQGWGSGDAEFYRQAASPFLRLVLRALEEGGQRASLAVVARYCDPDQLENMVLGLDIPDFYAEVKATVKALRSDERRAIGGLQARLSNLASSDFSRRWLDPEREAVRSVDLREAIRRREVVYFRLDTDRTGNVGRALAQMALLDLGAAASALMDRGVGTFVGIDEFGALEASAIDRLFTRGRAAGFSVAVGTQTIADLSAAGPAVRERIGATVETIICHRLGSQADAEWIASLVGTVPTWETTSRTDAWGLPTGEGTRTRGHRFEVHPAELQRLARGEAYVARLGDGSATRSARARVVPACERMSALQGSLKKDGPSGPKGDNR